MSERRVTEGNSRRGRTRGDSDNRSPLSISERFGLIANSSRNNNSLRPHINFKSQRGSPRGGRGYRNTYYNNNNNNNNNNNGQRSYRGGGRGRGGFRGRGRGGGRGGRRDLSKEQLDKDLENYNGQDPERLRASLDQEMTDYNNQAIQLNQEQSQQSQPAQQ